MAKLKGTEYTNPISGAKSNLFDLGSLWSAILGVVVFVFIFNMGEKVASFLGGHGVPFVSSTTSNPFQAQQQQTSSAPQVPVI